MKKLLILSAVATVFAISAQAAITYEMTKGYKDGTLAESTMGYYSLYARAAVDTATFGSTREAIESYFTKAVADGTWATAKAAWQNDKATDVTRGAGHVFANKAITTSNTLTFDRTSSEEQFNYWAVVFYQNGDTEGFRVIEAVNKTGQRATIAEGKNGTWGEWKTVPEPTSGLLMLLGLAGLALKRKRA